MFRLELILLLTLFNSVFLNAGNYNGDILNIYSKMIPRFIIMSTQKEKIKDDIAICILSDKLDNIEAILLRDKIQKNYPKGLLNYPLNIIQTDYTKIKSCKNTQLIFMFDSNEENIQNTIDFLQKNQILSVSYNRDLLEKGIDISLFIGKKVTPYINYKSITSKKIVLDNLLIRVSKIYKVNNK